jgi:integrase
MATSKHSKRTQKSYTTGDKGKNRVRLYPHERSGTLMLEFYNEAGTRKRISLGHTDFTLGKLKANELAAELAKNEGCPVGDLTLKALFDKYVCEVTPTKGPSAQGHDRRARKLFEACWGNAKVKNLDRTDWDRFIQQRRTGALWPQGERRKKRGVRDRVIEFDLKFLLAACNWATTVRVKGQPLLERNPFKGLPIPVETSPRRPIVSDDELTRLTEAAKELGPEVELYVLLVRETGHRSSAVAALRWSDLDLENRWVTWRAENDKQGREHSTPLTQKAVEALKAAKRKAARIGDGWVFPDPDKPEQPANRQLHAQNWYRLERKAGLARIPGRGWHSLRRKFATDLKHDTPLSDLCALGGWKGPEVLLRCYMQADERTMRAALDRRAQRLASGQ